jgi:hypothetical protein
MVREKVWVSDGLKAQKHNVEHLKY